MSFNEAMEELEIPGDASPRTKMRAVLQWHLGDTSWHDQLVEWFEDAGYELKEAQSN